MWRRLTEIRTEIVSAWMGNVPVASRAVGAVDVACAVEVADRAVLACAEVAVSTVVHAGLRGSGAGSGGRGVLATKTTARSKPKERQG